MLYVLFLVLIVTRLCQARISNSLTGSVRTREGVVAETCDIV